MPQTYKFHFNLLIYVQIIEIIWNWIKFLKRRVEHNLYQAEDESKS